jgi:hypothetical protein
MRKQWLSPLGIALAIALVVGWGIVLTGTTRASASQDKNAQAAKADEKGQDKVDKKELEAKACGTKEVDFDVETDKKQHPTPDPEPGKALVYILRSGLAGGAIQTKAAVDGTWIGANRGNNYFFVQVGPGEHYICSKAENTSLLTINVEAGKTYYVRQEISMGFAKARNKAVLMDEEKGAKELAKCHPSIATEKK